MHMRGVDQQEGWCGSRYNQYVCFYKLRGMMEPCDMYWGMKQS